MTTTEFVEALDYVRSEWGAAVIKEAFLTPTKPMTFDEFSKHCTACGGDWGAMLLSGVHELYPEVWDAIPSAMGAHAFATICNLLVLLNVDTKG